MKRTFDLVFSGLGLLVLSPLFLFLVLIIRIFSPGPAFFVQERAGRGGKIFRMWKFRSMTVGADRTGAQITVGGDKRITAIGRVLRACKMDELPQLWNVLKGEMSLVGPRPEVLKYVALYTPEQRQVLELKPGITDPASFGFYDESELLAQAQDPERYYQEHLVGEKIRINLAYAHKSSVLTDFVLILATLAKGIGLHMDIFAWLQIPAPKVASRAEFLDF